MPWMNIWCCSHGVGSTVDMEHTGGNRLDIQVFAGVSEGDDERLPLLEKNLLGQGQITFAQALLHR